MVNHVNLHLKDQELDINTEAAEVAHGGLGATSTALR
jgi:hypothetical protein